MYLMFGIEPRDFIGIANDEEFTQKLLAEENVLLLPGAVSTSYYVLWLSLMSCCCCLSCSGLMIYTSPIASSLSS